MFTTATLSDGRTLEYADVGDPSGTPMVLCHGTPATAGQASVIAGSAARRGVRLVAPTRPGYGASTLSPPGLAASAPDVLELADQLGIERFALMGTSGGGPFALAVAGAAPDRAALVSVHAGPGCWAQVNPDVLGDDDRRALDLVAAGDVDEGMAVMVALADADLGGLRELSPADFSVALARLAPPGENWLDRYPDLKRAFQADFRRAIATGAGMARDNLSWLASWDFDLATVTSPVRLVYGEGDQMIPPRHGEWLRERLPSSELHVVPGGHGDVTFGAAEEAFAALASG